MSRPEVCKNAHLLTLAINTNDTGKMAAPTISIPCRLRDCCGVHKLLDCLAQRWQPVHHRFYTAGAINYQATFFFQYVRGSLAARELQVNGGLR